jgi:hypothetical protein
MKIKDMPAAAQFIAIKERVTKISNAGFFEYVAKAQEFIGNHHAVRDCAKSLQSQIVLDCVMSFGMAKEVVSFIALHEGFPEKEQFAKEYCIGAIMRVMVQSCQHLNPFFSKQVLYFQYDLLDEIYDREIKSKEQNVQLH